MAKRPEEEQPQAMNAMDQTTQSPDPIAGAQPETGQPSPNPPVQPPAQQLNRQDFIAPPAGSDPHTQQLMDQEPLRGRDRNPESGTIPEHLGGTTQDPNFSNANETYQGLRSGNLSGAQLDYVNQMRAESGQPPLQSSEDQIGYYFELLGEGRNGPSLFPNLTASQFQGRDDLNARLRQRDIDSVAALDDAARRRQEEQDQFYRDLARDRQPEWMQRDSDRADAFLRGEGTSPPPPPTGPRETEEEALARIADRGRRQEERERFKDIQVEQARMRRGLPALNEDARRAVEGGADAIKNYRQGPQAQQQQGVGELSQMPAVYVNGQLQPAGTTGATAGQQGGGGYQTGQTVPLQNMPGGQESTTVYSMGDVALPDGQGMSTEDFAAAFEQLNPGKSPIDAVQSLAREPGPAGNAARKLLRDAGATGGAPLSQGQREQIESEIGGRASELLRGHAQSMERGITSSQQRISKAQQDQAEALASDARSIREDVYAKAQKAYEQDQSGSSFEEIFSKTMSAELARRQYESGQALSPDLINEVFGSGFAPPTPERGPRDYEPVDVNMLVVRPDSVPQEALGDHGGIDPRTGRLTFSVPSEAGDITLPAAYHNGKVVPVIQRPDQTGLLPSGTPYILGNKYMYKGTPGRPSTGTSTAGTSTGRSAGRSEADILQDEISDIRGDIQKRREDDFEASIEGELTERENLLGWIASEATSAENRATYQQRLKNLDEVIAQKREAANLDAPIGNEEILSEYRTRQDSKRLDQELASNLLFETGNQQEFDSRSQRSLPTTAQVMASAAGSTVEIDGRSIPATMVGKTPVLRPGSVDDIIAIEQNARGNVFTSSMGEDVIGIAGGEVYKTSSQARLDLTELAERDQYAMFSNQEETITLLDQYVSSKYPDLDMSQKELVMEAVAESVGLSIEPPSRGELQSRAEQAGLEFGYEGSQKQQEAAAAQARFGSLSPEAIIQSARNSPSLLRSFRTNESEDRINYDVGRIAINEFAMQARNVAYDETMRQLDHLPYLEAYEIAERAARERGLDAMAHMRDYLREQGIATNYVELRELEGRPMEEGNSRADGFVEDTELRREIERRNKERSAQNADLSFLGQQ